MSGWAVTLESTCTILFANLRTFLKFDNCQSEPGTQTDKSGKYLEWSRQQTWVYWA